MQKNGKSSGMMNVAIEDGIKGSGKRKLNASIKLHERINFIEVVVQSSAAENID